MLSAAARAKVAARFNAHLEKELAAARAAPFELTPAAAGVDTCRKQWAGLRPAADGDMAAFVDTGVAAPTLRAVGAARCER